MAYAGYISYPTASLASVGALSNLIAVIDLADAFGAAGFAWANVRADGGNIYVTDDAGAQMPAYIEAIDTTAQTGFLWIRKPSYNGGTSSIVRIHIDDSAVSAPAVGATYGRNEVFQDNFGNYLFQNGDLIDSTGNYDLTDTTTVSGTDGKLGDGFQMNGAQGAYSTSMNDYHGSGVLSVSAWMKLTTNPGFAADRAVIASSWQPSTTNRSWGFRLSPSNIETFFSANGSSTVIDLTSHSLSLNTWARYSFVFDQPNVRVYKDGVFLQQHALGITSLYPSATNDFQFGTQKNGYGQTRGFIDNLALSTNAWSDDYVKATYENQNNPAGFWDAPTWNPAAAPSPIFIPQVISI